MEALPVVTSARESDKRLLKMWIAASAVGLAETLRREATSVKFLAHLLDLIPQLTERNGSDQDRRRITGKPYLTDYGTLADNPGMTDEPTVSGLRSDWMGTEHVLQTYRGLKHSGVAATLCSQLQT